LSETLDVLTPIVAQKVYLKVVEQVIDLIERGVFPPGTYLPPERDLARQLGISRASLREALTVLKLQGVVETRSGEGTFICVDFGTSVARVNPARMNEGESPFALLEARKAVEPTVAALAATRRSEAALKQLAEILERVDREWPPQIRSNVYNEGDRNFHLSLALATENAVLIRIQRLFHSMMGQPLWLALEQCARWNTAGSWQLFTGEHHQIYEAVRDRDAPRARECMALHLEQVEKIMGEAELETDREIIN